MKYPFLLFALLMFLPSSAWAVPTFDDRTISTALDVTSFSFSHTIGGGCANNVVILNNVLVGVVPAVTSATVDSASTSPVAAIANYESTGGSIDMQQKTGVATGAITVEAFFNETVAITFMSARSYCDVNQATPVGSAITDSGTPGTPYMTVFHIDVPSAAGELVIDFSTGGDPDDHDPDTYTVGGDQTERTNYTEYIGLVQVLESDKAGEASTTMAWTYNGTTSVYWAMIGVPLKPAAAATVVRHRPIIQ